MKRLFVIFGLGVAFMSADVNATADFNRALVCRATGETGSCAGDLCIGGVRTDPSFKTEA